MRQRGEASKERRVQNHVRHQRTEGRVRSVGARGESGCDRGCQIQGAGGGEEQRGSAVLSQKCLENGPDATRVGLVREVVRDAGAEGGIEGEVNAPPQLLPVTPLLSSRHLACSLGPKHPAPLHALHTQPPTLMSPLRSCCQQVQRACRWLVATQQRGSGLPGCCTRQHSQS